MLLSSGSVGRHCPQCREICDGFHQLPPLTSPHDWFDAVVDGVDDGTQTLSKCVLLEALAATCPLAQSELDSILTPLWPKIGPIDKASFVRDLAPWLATATTTAAVDGLIKRSPSQELLILFPERDVSHVRSTLASAGGDLGHAAAVLVSENA